jgi:anti-sigma regulatory factor (Ser/Thr protein kinase)
MPGMARHFVRAVLETTEVEAAVIETAELLTSEVVTNVVVHVGSASELLVQAVGGAVRVRITDDDDRRPEMTNPTAGDAHGRGLRIVDALADAWGVDSDPVHGKTVWFELRSRARARGIALTNR